MNIFRIFLALTLLASPSFAMDCTGCTGDLNLGTVVSQPGVTLTVELDSTFKKPNGECKPKHQICVRSKPCNFFLKFTRKVPATGTYTLLFCTWLPATDLWECIVTNPNVTSADNGSNTEAVSLPCNTTSDLHQVRLAGASLVYSMTCNPCDN